MVGEGGFSKVVLVRARAGHGANGEVYYPPVGMLRVGGKTVEQVRSMISTALSKEIRDPRVDVNKARHDGFAPIHFACILTDVSVVAALLQRPDLDLNTLGVSLGFAPRGRATY